MSSEDGSACRFIRSFKIGKNKSAQEESCRENCLTIPCKPDYTVKDIYGEVRRQLGLSDLTEVKSANSTKVAVGADVKEKQEYSS